MMIGGSDDTVQNESSPPRGPGPRAIFRALLIRLNITSVSLLRHNTYLVITWIRFWERICNLPSQRQQKIQFIHDNTRRSRLSLDSTTMELFYFNLYAPDLEKSKVFYKKVLGWEIGGGSLGGHVNNTNTPCGVGPGSTTNTVYFTTDNLNESMAKVKAEGGKVLSQQMFEGIGPAAFCEDNQGTNFAFQEPGTPEMKKHATDVKKGSKHGDLFFFSLPVQDEDKARRFYTTVLGWTFGEKGKQGGMGIENMKGPDGGLGCGREGHHPSLWFRVDNIREAVAAVKEAGGSAGDIFDAPEGTMSEVVDDQGVKFGIVQVAPEF